MNSSKTWNKSKSEIVQELISNPIKNPRLYIECFENISSPTIVEKEFAILSHLEMGNVTEAKKLLVGLKSMDPRKFTILQEYIAECDGNLDQLGELPEMKELIQLHGELLSLDDKETFGIKRMVAIHKQRGNMVDAIKLLNSHLTVHQNDTEAYAELAEMYLTVHDYKKALFCVEELILSNPHHYLYHQLAAEICVTMGDVKNATMFYKASIKCHPTCLRSILGLALCESKDVVSIYNEQH